MTLDEYQKQALTTDSFKNNLPVPVTEPAYIAQILGLAGEAGEVAEKYKKIIRNKNGRLDTQDQKELIKELGDVLWYVAVLARYLETDLETVARQNLDKLADRQNRDVIKSQGDNR